MYVVALIIDTSGTTQDCWGRYMRRFIILILGLLRLTSLFGSGVVSGVRLSVLLVTKLEYFLRLLGYNIHDKFKTNTYIL